MVTQYYEADVNKEHVIRGNAAVIKCLIPSFVADFVEVISWHTDQEENFFPSNVYGAFTSKYLNGGRAHSDVKELNPCPNFSLHNTNPPKYAMIFILAFSYT